MCEDLNIGGDVEDANGDNVSDQDHSYGRKEEDNLNHKFSFHSSFFKLTVFSFPYRPEQRFDGNLHPSAPYLATLTNLASPSIYSTPL